MKAGNENREDRGLTQLAAMIAVLLSMASLLAVAFKLNDNQQTISSAAAASAVPAENVRVEVKSDEEHGKKGPEGTWHDAFVPADFSVRHGRTVTVTVLNYDDAPHTFTAPELGVNKEIAPGSETEPSETTFTFHAPEKAGSYEWFCSLPCDPFAMNNDGFMRGHVTVT